MKKAVIIFAIIFTGAAASGKSIWVDRNHFSSGGALNIGDIIVVNVDDMSSLQFTLSLKNTSDSSTTSSPDVTITGFLPKIQGSRNIKNNDATTFNGKGRFSFSIASRIQKREQGGKFTVAGSRTYSFNGVTSTVAIRGIIDPALIKGRNIDSRSVADFRIEIRSTREGFRLQRPALKDDEKAEVKLTEAEKQRIIIQYLEKMLNQLSR